MVTFTTRLLQMGNNVGIEVPEDVVLGFGAGRRVPVTVTLNGHTYPSTIATMGGRFLVPVSRAVREAAGVAGGEDHDVTLLHDTSPRRPDLPDDLAAALDSAGLREAFDALPPGRAKEHVRTVVDAKKAATRAARVQKVVDALSG
ncbi:YdeI/OmpD-associated family protein [Aeromicrobium fastidiosum]|uniref:YdeI/OmpD-associated family protein n=1 Tax=Aeromicrobium fastidiosum TaxID=52699 RepID=UPI0020237657|nr:YdeI/OmpD-associated family protein [Aeromicrobium fastidiosum]MCL8252991.1 YdeI/OmpD-associated family protein [Aeromicrobium fastidiosum]